MYKGNVSVVVELYSLSLVAPPTLEPGRLSRRADTLLNPFSFSLTISPFSHKQDDGAGIVSPSPKHGPGKKGAVPGILPREKWNNNPEIGLVASAPGWAPFPGMMKCDNFWSTTSTALGGSDRVGGCSSRRRLYEARAK